jgi:hypothetical protein
MASGEKAVVVGKNEMGAGEWATSADRRGFPDGGTVHMVTYSGPDHLFPHHSVMPDNLMPHILTAHPCGYCPSRQPVC